MTHPLAVRSLLVGAVAAMVLCSSGCRTCKATEVAPQWRIRVVESSGQPLPGLRVAQEWGEFGESDNFERLVTDARGEVVFPPRVLCVGPPRPPKSIHSSQGVFAWAGVLVKLPNDPGGPMIYPSDAQPHEGGVFSEVVLPAGWQPAPGSRQR